MDNALQWKNFYPVDNALGLVRNTQLRVGERRGEVTNMQSGQRGFSGNWDYTQHWLSLISSLEDTILVNSKMRAIAVRLPQTMQNYQW